MGQNFDSLVIITLKRNICSLQATIILKKESFTVESDYARKGNPYFKTYPSPNAPLR